MDNTLLPRPKIKEKEKLLYKGVRILSLLLLFFSFFFGPGSRVLSTGPMFYIEWVDQDQGSQGCDTSQKLVKHRSCCNHLRFMSGSTLKRSVILQNKLVLLLTAKQGDNALDSICLSALSCLNC